MPERLHEDRATGSSACIQETYAEDFPCLLRIDGSAKRKEHGAKSKDGDFFLHCLLTGEQRRTQLLDHLVRPRQHVRWNRQADLLRRFQIDDEFELRRLLDGQIGGLGALENLVDVIAARRYKSAGSAP